MLITTSIPTQYRKIWFRSRLEAHWAAFFDLAGWRWEYEPIDYSGWIPDFVLIGDDTYPLLEVKPIYWTCQGNFLCDKDKDGLANINNLIEKQEIKEMYENDCKLDLDALPEILVLGAFPHQIQGGLMLGRFLREAQGNESVALFGLNEQNDAKPRLDFYADPGSASYRICGRWEANHHLHSVNPNDVLDLWHESGNVVQWRKPKQVETNHLFHGDRI